MLTKYLKTFLFPFFFFFFKPAGMKSLEEVQTTTCGKWHWKTCGLSRQRKEYAWRSPQHPATSPEGNEYPIIPVHLLPHTDVSDTLMDHKWSLTFMWGSREEETNILTPLAFPSLPQIFHVKPAHLTVVYRYYQGVHPWWSSSKAGTVHLRPSKPWALWNSMSLTHTLKLTVAHIKTLKKHRFLIKTKGEYSGLFSKGWSNLFCDDQTTEAVFLRWYSQWYFIMASFQKTRYLISQIVRCY